MGKPNQTSPGPLVEPSGKVSEQSQDFSGQVPRNDGQEPGQADTTTLHKVSLPGERGTRRLKVFDGAAIEQLLGTRTGY